MLNLLLQVNDLRNEGEMMTKLGLCEQMSLSWNKQRILKALRRHTKKLKSRVNAHTDVRGGVNRLVLAWKNTDKALLLLKWYEELV